MLDQMVVIYCFCDEIVKTLNYKDDLQCKMSTAEIMTFSLMSAMIFGGNYRTSRLMAMYHRYFPKILSHSQLVRRIHAIPDEIWVLVFKALQVILPQEDCQHFIVDSFPLKTYETHKSFRAKIFKGKQYHGYSASKKQYYFGIKVHMIINSKGIPIEFSITPASISDIRALQNFSLNLPKGSILMGDKAYTNYQFEDDLANFEDIRMLVKRRKNLKRQNNYNDNQLLKNERNYIETVFSSIVSKMPRHIRARIEKGFYLKIILFIFAYMFNLYVSLG